MLRVTDMIALVGLIETEWFTEEACARGTAVHLATALDDAGDLDESSVHPAVAPYLESWRRFRAETGLTVLHAELEVIHPGMNYIGHLDRVVDWGGEVLIDLKCGGASGWHPLQTSLYALAYAAQHAKPTPRRGCVYLDGDGKPGKFKEHKDRRDFEIAKAIVTLAQFKGQAK